MSTVRISGVIMAPNKHLRIALRGIFGIGNTRALQICEELSLDPTMKVNAIREDLFPKIQQAINRFEVEGDLRRRISTNIKRLIDIKCYRGLRHKKGLPVRGQRTKTNARTRKGRKRSKSSGSA